MSPSLSLSLRVLVLIVCCFFRIRCRCFCRCVHSFLLMWFACVWIYCKHIGFVHNYDSCNNFFPCKHYNACVNKKNYQEFNVLIIHTAYKIAVYKIRFPALLFCFTHFLCAVVFFFSFSITWEYTIHCHFLYDCLHLLIINTVSRTLWNPLSLSRSFFLLNCHQMQQCRKFFTQ